jgi:hypothetical protein
LPQSITVRHTLGVNLRRTRAALATSTATTLLLLGLAACSGSSQPGADGNPTPTVEEEPEPEEEPDEAAVRDVVERYWQAYIRNENELGVDPELFRSTARGEFVEDHLRRASHY